MKPKNNLFKTLLGIVGCMLMAVTFNAAAGATCAVAIGCAPEAGAIAGNVLALALQGAAPSGALRAGVLKEIWTGEQIKQFRTALESCGWLARIRSYNQHVDNDVIHFVAIGGDPKVLVNNTTYPIPVTALEDADKPIGLDKFSTEATPVTDDELHAISYDKMASVKEATATPLWRHSEPTQSMRLPPPRTRQVFPYCVPPGQPMAVASA